MKIKATFTEIQEKEVDVSLREVLKKIEELILDKIKEEKFTEYELRLSEQGRLIQFWDMQGRGNDIEEDITLSVNPAIQDLLRQWRNITKLLRGEWICK